MLYKKHKLTGQDIPGRLQSIPSPPKVLFYIGDMGICRDKPTVAIVGSRKVTPYGKEVTALFARALAMRGIVIISGLAFGVDAVAHRSTLDAGGKTIAVLPSGIDQFTPASHASLARNIIDSGGAVISEYEPGHPAYKQNFVARNRIVAGLADVVLITEAGEGSGSLHTARFATKQNKPVFAVPGPINNPISAGTNQLIKAGAHVATTPDDLLSVLDLKIKSTKAQTKIDTNQISDPAERTIIELLQSGINDMHRLQRESKLTSSAFSQAVTMLELNDSITQTGTEINLAG